ncbi:MAG: amino acid adenylation domain-containing protein [Planctomycetota bacterium]
MLLTDLFLRSVARHGERLAVEVPPGVDRPERRQVRYAQLCAMADRVRRELLGHVDREAMVVVLLPRETPWLYAAQLGVLWAGAAHVCLDGGFPDAHVAHVVRDTAAVCVITDAASRARFDGFGVPVFVVPEACDEVAPLQGAPAPLPAWSTERSLAYAIYTSGTTGKPKGVLVEHRGVVNLIEQGLQRFAMSPTDRMSQNSSPAYDSSVEEIWLALAAGAALVVMDDVTVRSGPDLVAWLRRERVTILCPPPTLLRTMACRSPRDELPELRMCYVGGESLSDDLAEVWGGALRLENGYGPTECTVTVVRGQVLPGEPVTIGAPVPPHVAHVLDEQLQPVPPGWPGELCIAGPGLARGYLGLDELTEQRFPTLPGIGRVYRTGDLVTVDQRGRLHYHGRIDAQVKVRGYRIELEAIETVLARCPGVREVALAVQGNEPERFLVAHVVPADDAARPEVAALTQAVASELPAYMVPAHFAWLRSLPRTVGGKVSRKQLPPIEVTAVADTFVDDGTAHAALRRGFGEVLGLPAERLADDDDFFACGGNSLRAAMLVSRLRDHRALQAVAVRDVYRTPTVAGLLAAVGTRAGSGVDRSVDASTHGSAQGSLAAFSLVQVLFLSGLLLAASGAMWGLAAWLLPWLLSLPLVVVLFALPWLVPVTRVAFGALGVVAAVVAKWTLIGRYRPGRVSAWSAMRLRHWIVARLAQLVPWGWLEGTELQSVVLRLLGARVGRRVHVHRGVALHDGGWDLLDLGDDVTLGRDVELGTCELDDGELVVGAVRIGAGATLEARSGIGPDAEVGAGAIVRPLTFVPSGMRVAAGHVVDGVPAETVGQAPRAPRAGAGRAWRYSIAVLALRLFGSALVWLPWALVAWLLADTFAVDGAAVRQWLLVDGPSSTPALFGWLVAASLLAVPLGVLQIALLLRLLPGVAEGTFSRWSLRHWWMTVRMRWLEDAGEWLSGTLFWPRWLRLAGMRVAHDVEVSSIHDVLPERTSLGGHSFLADGVYLGVPRIHQGLVTVGSTSLGARTFVGNHVVVEQGQRLPDDLLLGISTVADDATMRAGSSWFGHPAFSLPQREVVAVDRRLTYEPGPLRVVNRLFWEALRFALPALPTALALWWFDAFAAWGFGGVLAATATAAAALAAVVLGTKWLLLGRVRPGQHGLWSCWASRWDFHYVMWQRYGRALLTPLEGTLLLPWYLRAMGMRIGRRCVLGDGFAQVVDPDMITIEDGATVHALFQAHSFEDRVLKIDRVRLGARCTVGRGAVVLYGADVGDDAHVMPHSVVMKRERLLPARRYAGAPTDEIT